MYKLPKIKSCILPNWKVIGVQTLVSDVISELIIEDKVGKVSNIAQKTKWKQLYELNTQPGAYVS